MKKSTILILLVFGALLAGWFVMSQKPDKGENQSQARNDSGKEKSEPKAEETPSPSPGSEEKSQQNQPGADSIQEWAVQTSNYSAEFGQAGNAIMNVTMKSGTNQFHGSAYDYFVNEFMNAGQPFTNDGQGHLIRTKSRRPDWASGSSPSPPS